MIDRKTKVIPACSQRQGRRGLTILLSLVLALLAGCNLSAVVLSPTAPSATAAVGPQVQILSPAHNLQIVQGSIIDLDILASDSTAGIDRIELHVDERLHHSSVADGEPGPAYRVRMNWFAGDLGWHKFVAIASSTDGSSSPSHIIALEVVAG